MNHTNRDRWLAPWTDEQVTALNEQQADATLHAYTCPNAGYDCRERTLIATRDGWNCVCGRYTQQWAHPVREIARPAPSPEAQRGRMGP